MRHVQYKGGIVDFVKHSQCQSKRSSLQQGCCTLKTKTKKKACKLDIAIQWNTGYYEGIHGYANGISTTEGGMHVEGFKTALTSVLNKYARDKVDL